MAKVNPIPRGLHTLTPNLTISNCGKAIEFYKRALGAELIRLAPSPDGKSVWHAELRVGSSSFFVNDEMPGMSPAPPTPERRSPVRMWVYVADCDAAFNRAVAAGATSNAPPVDMFWGDRCAMVADPFGFEWTFATRVKDMTDEETRIAGEKFAKSMANRPA
jgi:PhnB protein